MEALCALTPGYPRASAPNPVPSSRASSGRWLPSACARAIIKVLTSVEHSPAVQLAESPLRRLMPRGANGGPLMASNSSCSAMSWGATTPDAIAVARLTMPPTRLEKVTRRHELPNTDVLR